MSSSSTIFYRKHGFTFALLLVLFLAFVHPEFGVKGTPLHSEWMTKIGVWIIFFLQGLCLSPKELAQGYKPIRLQAFVLAWNYLFFPLVTMSCLFLAGAWLSRDIILGFGLLSILPTTIASAVTFTGMAGGSTANAICATVVSNLLAVLLVPIWVATYFQAGIGVELPIVSLFSKLALLIVLPLILGQLFRVVANSLAVVASRWTKRISSYIILYIVYVAFANSVGHGQFYLFSILEISGLIFGSVALVFISSLLVWISSAPLKLTETERLAAFFSSSQKSLATGVPLATAIFAVIPDFSVFNTGVILLPLIVFHPLQLIAAAFWVDRSGPFRRM